MGRPSPAAYRKSKLDPCVEESLRKHGEAFMSMFDDNSDDEGRGNVSNGPNEPIDGGADLENTPQECRPPIMATSKRKKQKKKDKHGQDNATGPKPNSAPRKREQDELDDIFASRPAIRPTQKRATTSKREAEERLLREREDEMLRRKVERKRFMSSSADSMYSFDGEARLREAKQRLDRSRSAGHGPDKKKEMEEFKAIRREIQSFGMSLFSSHEWMYTVMKETGPFPHRPASAAEFFWRHLRPCIRY